MAISERLQIGSFKEEFGKKPNIGFGFYLPRNVLTNQEIELWKVNTQNGTLSASDIHSKLGIERRFVAGKDETVLSMGVKAVNDALEGKKDVDVLITSSSFPTGVNLSDEIRKELSLSVDSLIEVGAACSGFTRSLAYLKENEERFRGQRVAIVSTEKFSDKVHDLKNKNSKPDLSLSQAIFSDGTYVMVFIFGREGLDVLSYSNYRFPEQYKNQIRMPINEDLIRHPYLQEPVANDCKEFEMDGKGVFKAVVKTIPGKILETVENSRLKPEDISLIIPHQASKRMLEGVEERLPQFQGRLFYDLENGNFSSASIPKAIKRAVDEGRLKKGDNAVLAGFGAGLFVSIAVVRFG